MKKTLFLSMFVSGLAFAQVNPNVTTNFKSNADKLNNYQEFIQSKNTASFLPGYREYFYNSGSGMELFNRNEYTYVNSNKIGEDLSMYWTGTEFENSQRTTNEYTASFERRLVESWSFIDEEWQPSWLDSAYYDAFFNVIRSVGYQYNSIDEVWVLQYGGVTEYVYDASNRVVEITYYDIDVSDLSTEPMSREEWDWTGTTGGPTSLLAYQWDSTDEEWTLSMRAIDIEWFDFSQFLVSNVEVEFWNDTTEEWEKAFSFESTYFANGMTEEMIEREWDADDEVYVNLYRDVYTIDANMVLTSTHYYDWDEDNDEWEIVYGVLYTNTYGPNAELVQQDMAYYNDVTGDYDDTDRYVFGDHINVASVAQNQLNRSVYPNPTVDVLNIEIGEENGKAVIMDLAGKLIGEYSLDYEITTISVADFTPGIYVMVVHTSQGSSAHKFVKR